MGSNVFARSYWKVMHKRTFFLMSACVVSMGSFAQSTVMQAGKIRSASIKAREVKITLENGEANVTVYSPSIVRIRLNNQKLADDFSYAVIAKPVETKSTITQNNNEIVITTDSLKAVIGKNPFSVAFYTPNGELINEDEKGLTTSWIGTEVTDYKKMQEGERFVGLGEKTGNLDRRGFGYTNWNSDFFGYQANQDPLYSSIPFYIGIHHGLNYGIFLDNTYQTDFNFGASNDRFSSFSAKGGELNYYFIYNKNVAGIISSYTSLTGRMQLPPLWSLGYQQNRYSYYPDTEVLRIAQTLREKKIPADGITLDIHYMENYKLFTWNKERFADPKAMNNKLQSMGFKTTVIVDPGIKVEKGYEAYESGLKNDVFIKYSDGQNYTGQVWPGWCHFPDFTNEKGRNWWKGELKYLTNTGVSGIWNDMNEISTWGQKMPNNVLFDYDNHPTTHLQAHNVYALQMARSSYEGARAILNKRPFILTRAGFAGLQRYTAIWTGDNRAEDDHMLAGVRLLNSLGLSGVPFTGMDVGGFTGNPSVGLYTRWMQLGAFIPYFRNHTQLNTKSSEPWAFGEEVLEISRNYISLRYKLLPYLYSTFYEATQNGLPVVRSLAIDYTHDAKIYEPVFQNQFTFGRSFLVAPVESGKDFMKIYFPQGKWYNLYNDAEVNGGNEKIEELTTQKLPVYVKESSIIPMQSLIQSTVEKPTDTLNIHVYKGSVPNTFVYYEDDGTTYDYEAGSYYKRTISYDPATNTIVMNKAEGKAASSFKNIALILHGFDGLGNIKVNETNYSLQDGTISFLSAISKFDPQGNLSSADGCKVKMTVFKNESGEMKISM